ncbi:MAG TPA: hypothetical protein VF533_23210 [Solirubrobacteraceae bacterium]|jgi:hypothetical protein
MPKRSTVLTTAVLACLALAAPASADSISFMRGGDVWVAAPDGSRQTQITHDGGYSYQSRADDGSFIALHGRRLHRLAPDGRLLADFDTPVSGERTDNLSSYFLGPFRPEISPDGSKVAYEYRYFAVENDPGCFPAGYPNCQDVRQWTGIGYSHPDRQTGWDEPGLGRQSGWTHPSWIGNDTLLLSDKSVQFNLDAMIDHVGDGNQEIQGWFSDDGAWSLKDGEITRQGDKAAFVSTKVRSGSDPDIGKSDDQVTIYRLNGAPPALPEQCFSFGSPNGTYKSPTFSPDGGRIAFEDSDGQLPPRILTGEVPPLAGGCRLPSAGANAIIEDARQPDWSPADVPAVGAPVTPVKHDPVAPPEVDPAKPALTVAGGKLRLATALRKGVRVKVTVPAAGRLTAKATAAGRKVGSGKARANGAGAESVTIRLTRAAKRRLQRGSGPAKLKVTVRFLPAGGGKAQVTRTVVKLKR